MTNEKTIKLLSQYTPLDFHITDINLTFELSATETIVTSIMKIKKLNKDAHKLILLGEKIELLEVKVNDKVLESNDYRLTEKDLSFQFQDMDAVVTIKNSLSPERNLACDGLYLSGDVICTQNEPEGFRKITYFLDRPDNMSSFTTKIIADKKEYPYLLANGNKVDEGELENGKHYCTWNDPFFKPSYLFAIVAGDLALVKDTFQTQSGRDVQIEFYVDKGNEN